jgi:hypothetical protein
VKMAAEKHLWPPGLVPGWAATVVPPDLVLENALLDLHLRLLNLRLLRSGVPAKS